MVMTMTMYYQHQASSLFIADRIVLQKYVWINIDQRAILNKEVGANLIC